MTTDQSRLLAMLARLDQMAAEAKSLPRFHEIEEMIAEMQQVIANLQANVVMQLNADRR